MLGRLSWHPSGDPAPCLVFVCYHAKITKSCSVQAEESLPRERSRPWAPLHGCPSSRVVDLEFTCGSSMNSILWRSCVFWSTKKRCWGELGKERGFENSCAVESLHQLFCPRPGREARHSNPCLEDSILQHHYYSLGTNLHLRWFLISNDCDQVWSLC